MLVEGESMEESVRWVLILWLDGTSDGISHLAMPDIMDTVSSSRS